MFNFIKDSFLALKSQEKSFLKLAVGGILLLTSLPLIFGVLFSGGDYFTGQTVIGGSDKMVYFSQITEAAQGHFFLHNLYTSEPQTAYFSPFWLVLGWLSRLMRVSPLAVFHLLRLLAGAVFLILSYLFISKIFKDIFWRCLTFLVLSLSSGLGVFTVFRPWTQENIYQYFGADIWFSEGNTFLSLYHSPLFIFSQICLLLIFWWLIARLWRPGFKEPALIGLLALLLGLIHPYDLAIIYPIAGAWFLVNCFLAKKWLWPQLNRLLIIMGLSFLAIVYFFWLAGQSQAFAGWAVQNITLSPRLLNYVIGYGLVFLAFSLGLYPALKSRHRYLLFLGVWAIISWFLLFSPIQFQRRLGNGLHLPMVLIGCWWFFRVCQRWQGTWAERWWKNFKLNYLLAGLVIFLLVSSNLLLIGAEYFASRYLKIFYLSVPEKQAMLWLKDNLRPGELILSSAKKGNLIPALSGRLVYLGHGHQTNNWPEKKAKVEEWFFKSNGSDEQKARWLKAAGIDWLFFGPSENALGDFNPQAKDYLQPVFKQGKITVFKVVN